MSVNDNVSVNDNEGGEQRLRDIERRINVLHQQKQDAGRPNQLGLPPETGAIMGRVVTELIVGGIVGSFIGWGLDKWLQTSPLFLLVLFFLGVFAGMLSVWRIVTGRGLAVGYFDEHKSKRVSDTNSKTNKEQERDE